MALVIPGSGAAWAQDGGALFEKLCAACHRPGSETRAPLPPAMAMLPREKIVAALESGSMRAQGVALTQDERLAIAAHLSKIGSGTQTMSAACPAGAPPFATRDGEPAWLGWGAGTANTRFQPAGIAGLSRDQIPRLKLKWAFGLARSNTALAQPVVAGGRLFFGAMDGTVYSLDARTGCTHWTFRAPAMVRSAIAIERVEDGRYSLYFGDVKANVYAIDAKDGALIWKTQVDEHPAARITGSPQVSGGRLFVPVSSIEEVFGRNPKYSCCTFRGSVVALETKSGKQIWKTHAIPDPPRPTHANSGGAQQIGPAGAAIWSAPTLDLKRKVLYAATGNGYSDPPDSHTDAILALDLQTGSLRWSQQMTPRDNWNLGCIHPSKPSCPEGAGTDLDFGASPILVSVGGRDLLVVGQKSGIVHALDPDKMGKIVWQTRVGKGGALGGIEWGSAADEENVYVALSDYSQSQPETGGGMFALRLMTGEKVWATPAPKPACAGRHGCTAAQMAAVTLIPGVAFSGSMDGHLRAYDTRDGKIIWDLDTLREFITVNGVEAHGGSLNAAGPTVAGGMLYVNSGYGALAGMAGNVLLAFGAE